MHNFVCIFVVATIVHLATSRATDFQPILTQISAGINDCNKSELLGGFDLKSVPQFNALCNIPVPDIEQSEFLIENNVVPILCMGLMDVSLRLCKSAKNDVSPFEDIFPPTPMKFRKIFDGLSKSNDFSSLDEFCSTTVKKFAIQEAVSNETELWWQVLNRRFGDPTTCSNICHSNEKNKVHPLCSYILWSNGVYVNYMKNQELTTVGDVKKSTTIEKVEEPINHKVKPDQAISVKSDLSTKPSEPVVGSDVALSTDEKAQIKESVVGTDNNNVGVGTVEQLVNKGDEAPTKTAENEANGSGIMDKENKDKLKIEPTKDTATNSNPVVGLNATEGSSIKVKTVSSAGQAKDVPKVDAGADAMPPSVSGPQEVVPPGKAEGMVEGDFSLEVTPEGVGLDQPIAADKDFQPPYSDEEGEDGDGDDVDIVEANAQATTNNNSSSPAGSKLTNSGIATSIQHGPLEGDKVYGEGEILIEDHFIEAEDSHFFTYFLCMAVLTIMAYLAFHNKKKLIALAVEGRRTKGGRRRPNSSHYSKLDCNLEEALVSNTTASVTHVLY
ncbi:trans-Golgi network integral membrane protein 2-like [Macrosteles quadrilineatus]|uniref:trans-Golgi network integral membrane protein 2-like n=1 Tax=Macrosteles quadrilineatus TaxID=74068 RepID=UPI0023E1721A|nr:trans-Golgi network integral membrane protein 2-like [Macrosteles quadrilineatus]